MAATRLIALHQNKGHSVAKCLADRVAYYENGEKTNNGEFISSYACDPKTADEEFVLSKRQYEYMTGKRNKNNIIGYQIRQSFRPGEITPEKANEVGYETAMRFTKGKHAFLVATHVDKAHIHNHIIFNSTSIDCKTKFKNFYFCALALQKLSDLVCLENGLFVISPKPYSERTKRTVYPKRTTHRDKIRNDIDRILIKKPKTFSDFIILLSEAGYEYKDGKYPAIRETGSERFVRFRSLGPEYSIENLNAAIVNGTGILRNPFSRRNEKSLDMLIDIQQKLVEGKNGGYVQWAKRFNVKQASKAIVFLQEHDIHSFESLTEKTKQVSARYDELNTFIKDSEKRLAEIALLRTHIINYSKTRDVYVRYRKSGYSKKFFEENREAIILHKAAKQAFEELHVEKIPRIKDLNMEYSELLNAKKEAYLEYRKVRDEMKEFQLAQEIAKTFLEDETVQKKKDKENTKEK